MDHSFTPLAAYRKFREKKYDERFVFAKQVRTDDAIQKVSESIRAKSEIRQEILDEIKRDWKAIYKNDDYNQLKYNTDLMNKWMKKNPKDGEKFMRFKDGFESK